MKRLAILIGALFMALLAPDPDRSAAKADETGAAGLVSMAETAEARGDNRMAIALYRRAHEAFPESGEALARWGLLAARLGAVEEAATLLAAALDVDPGNLEAAAGLAEVLVDLDRPAEALVLYDALLEADPADIAARDGRLFVLALMANPTQAALPTALAEAGTDQRQKTDAALASGPVSGAAIVETASPGQGTAITR
jgi:tetratricopeptide (TPR) repeat protein